MLVDNTAILFCMFYTLSLHNFSATQRVRERNGTYYESSSPYKSLIYMKVTLILLSKCVVKFHFEMEIFGQRVFPIYFFQLNEKHDKMYFMSNVIYFILSDLDSIATSLLE